MVRAKTQNQPGLAKHELSVPGFAEAHNLGSLQLSTLLVLQSHLYLQGLTGAEPYSPLASLCLISQGPPASDCSKLCWVASALGFLIDPPGSFPSLAFPHLIPTLGSAPRLPMQPSHCFCISTWPFSWAQKSSPGTAALCTEYILGVNRSELPCPLLPTDPQPGLLACFPGCF